MLKTTKTNEQKGFTIIEVLIVLAVAALILLVVFLAVPGLQRNQKNTQIKQEISRLSGAIVNFEANNGGNTPLNSSDLTSVLNDSNIASSSLIYTSTNQYTTTPYVTSSAQTLYLLSTGTAAYGSSPYTFGSQKTLTQVDIVPGFVCPATAGGATIQATAGSATNVAIFYTLHTASNDIWQCNQAS